MKSVLSELLPFGPLVLAITVLPAFYRYFIQKRFQDFRTLIRSGGRPIPRDRAILVGLALLMLVLAIAIGGLGVYALILKTS